MKSKTAVLWYLLGFIVILIGAFVACSLMVISTIGIKGIDSHLTEFLPLILLFGNTLLVAKLVRKNKIVATVFTMVFAITIYCLFFDIFSDLRLESDKRELISFPLSAAIYTYIMFLGIFTLYVYFKKKFDINNDGLHKDKYFWWFTSAFYVPFTVPFLCMTALFMCSFNNPVVAVISVIGVGICVMLLSGYLASYDERKACLFSVLTVIILFVLSFIFQFIFLCFVYMFAAFCIIVAMRYEEKLRNKEQ